MRSEKAICLGIQNLKYPTIARENGVQGNAVVGFVVERDGTVQGVTLRRDPGAGTGAEAMRVVNLMNTSGIKWTPGKQRGKPVRVQYNLPVRFRLRVTQVALHLKNKEKANLESFRDWLF